ncbi:MAG: glycosyltransferase [Blautia sp.]|nr:glycosyltransferase [Blautia sp.]MCM1200848.1 glycosyltransferase [Bacteroides fragilis]
MREMVSIIVPVYRAAPYIAETIEMVVKQTYQNWELLLIDDCSPDNSEEIIHHTIDKLSGQASGGAERIRFVRKEKNEGAAEARNTGIGLAKGRYIAFLDADDIWHPEKLEKELSFMEEKKAAFAFTAYEFGDEKAHGTGKIVKAPEQLTYRKALSRTVIFTSTVIFDTEKISRELIRMPVVESEDTAAWWKILRNGYTAYGLNEALVIYRRPAKSLSSNKFTALKRIWNLYRREEKLSLPVSAFCFCLWAFRATLRRI